MTTVSGTQTLPGQAFAVLAGRRRRRGFASWFTTVDHKKIGIMYAATAMVVPRRSVASRRC